MENQAVGKPGPFLGRQKTGEVMLDFGWIFLPGKTKAPGKPLAVGVDYDGGSFKGMTEYYVRGLAADSS
jgi:hypothetical protein